MVRLADGAARQPRFRVITEVANERLEEAAVGVVLAGRLGVGRSLRADGLPVRLRRPTPPSPYYMYDDVQSFPPGTEFRLSQEAAAQKTAKEEQALQQK